MTVNIDISNLDSGAPLYHKYPGQLQPQPAYLEIRPESNSAIFDYSGEIGTALPFAVYHRREWRIDVSPCAAGADLIRLASDGDFLDAINRVITGHAIEWNGNGYIGRFDDDAAVALDEIEKILENVDLVEVWDGDEWLNGEMYDENNDLLNTQQIADLTDDRINTLADIYTDVASSCNQVLFGITEAIETERDNAKTELENRD